jgi:hypothetical protein
MLARSKNESFYENENTKKNVAADYTLSFYYIIYSRMWLLISAFV